MPGPRTLKATQEPGRFFGGADGGGETDALEGELATDAGAVEIDHACVRRAGRDVSLITYGGSLPKTLAAADELARQGIEADVVDLRTRSRQDFDGLHPPVFCQAGLHLQVYVAHFAGRLHFDRARDFIDGIRISNRPLRIRPLTRQRRLGRISRRASAIEPCQKIGTVRRLQ